MRNPHLQKIKIDKRSSELLSMQLAQSIKSLLIDHDTNYLDLLPSPSEIAIYHQIDEACVLEAYQKLVEEKFVQRQGDQYIVNYFHLSADFYLKIIGVFNAISLLGMKPSFENISYSYTKLPSHLKIKPEFQHDDDYLCLKRIYYGNQTPLVLLDTYLPIKQYVSMDIFKETNAPIYEIIENQFNRKVSSAYRLFSVTNLDSEKASFLNASVNSATYQVASVSYDQHKKFIEISESWSIMNYFFELDFKREELLKIKANHLFYI